MLRQLVCVHLDLCTLVLVLLLGILCVCIRFCMLGYRQASDSVWCLYRLR